VTGKHVTTEWKINRVHPMILKGGWL